MTQHEFDAPGHRAVRPRKRDTRLHLHRLQDDELVARSGWLDGFVAEAGFSLDPAQESKTRRALRTFLEARRASEQLSDEGDADDVDDADGVDDAEEVDEPRLGIEDALGAAARK